MKIITKTNVAFLEIRTFVGTSAVGAEHYYGTVKCQESMYSYGEAEFSARMRRKIGKAEAAELNEKDGNDSYAAGMATDRFPTEAAVVAAAIKYCKSTFPQLFVLLEGSAMDDVPRWPCRVFWFKNTALLKRLNAINVMYRRADNQDDEDESQRLSLEWRAVWATVGKKF